MNHTVVVLVGGVHRGVLDALAYAKSLAPNHLLAMTIVADEEEQERVEQAWEEQGIDIPLEIVYSPYRELSRPVLRFVDELDMRWTNDIITVVIPEFVVTSWWGHLLHNQSALLLKGRLLFPKGHGRDVGPVPRRMSVRSPTRRHCNSTLAPIGRVRKARPGRGERYMRVLRADRWRHRVASLIAIVAALGVGIVATAPAASPPTWSIAPSPIRPGRRRLPRRDRTSATNCFAVGGYTFPNTQNRTLIQRWNGTSWTNMTSPFPANATGEPLGCCLRERDELFRGRELQPKRGNVSRLDPTVERHRLVDRCEPDHSRVDRRLACRSVVRDRAELLRRRQLRYRRRHEDAHRTVERRRMVGRREPEPGGGEHGVSQRRRVCKRDELFRRRRAWK